MTKRSRAAYEQVFAYVRDNLSRPDMVPSKVVTDYESALLGGIKDAYPESRIMGCWFHYTQVGHNSKLFIGDLQCSLYI